MKAWSDEPGDFDRLIHSAASVEPRKLYAVGDQLLTIRQCARKSKVAAGTLKTRMRRGQTMAEAMSKPVRAYRQNP